MPEIFTSEFENEEVKQESPKLLTEEDIENLEPQQLFEHLVRNEALQRELFGRVVSPEELKYKISLRVVRKVMESLGARFDSDESLKE